MKAEQDKLAEKIAVAVKAGGKVLICGNGGLAAESEHFAAELMGQFAFDVYIPCIALTSNTSLLTALANDIGYESAFSWQVQVLGNINDIFIGMTTSNSPNVMRALSIAMEKGLITIAVCGDRSRKISASYVYCLPGADTAIIQEGIVVFLHRLAYSVKERLKCLSSTPITV